MLKEEALLSGYMFWFENGDANNSRLREGFVEEA
jgi:hypothetical protein